MSAKLDGLKARLAANRVGLDWNGETDALSKCDAIAADAIAEIERMERERQWRTGAPPESGWYLVTMMSKDGSVQVTETHWSNDFNCWGVAPRVLAYMPLPAPWKEGE